MRRLIALVFAALLAAAPFAQAAVTANSFITPQTPQGYTPAQIVNGTGTSTYVTILTGETNGSKISSILVTSTDTIIHTVSCAIKVSSTSYQLFQVLIPAITGDTPSVLPLQLISQGVMPGLPQDSDGQPYLVLASGMIFQCEVLTTAVTSPDAITFIPQGADF